MKKFYFFLITLYSIQVFSQIDIKNDNSFGNNGVFTSDLTSNQTIRNSHIIILPDNSILNIINGEVNNLILKLKPNGTLDPTFGNNGRLDFQINNFMNAVLQGNKIIVYFGPKNSDSTNPYQDSKILRFTQNGVLDTTFGENGVLTEVTESINPQSLSVLVLTDESLVVSNSNATHPKKYTMNGQLESSYGNNGEIAYNYHFPIGQSSANRKIATCDITSLSSSVYSFYDLYSLTTNTVLNLNEAPCHQNNGEILQNKTNLSTRMTNNGIVYSIFEYKNYPLPDFSRLVVINNEKLDVAFNGNGFVSSEDNEQFLDSGFAQNIFFILNQKQNQKSINAYSATGNVISINDQRDFNLISGDQIEVQNNYILVNSIISDPNQSMGKVKIQKFMLSTDKLSVINNSVNTIEVENPVKEFLNIKNADNAVNFQIYNMEGRKVSEAKNFKNINISSLPKGNYLLKIVMKNGEFISKKLIKN